MFAVMVIKSQLFRLTISKDISNFMSASMSIPRRKRPMDVKRAAKPRRQAYKPSGRVPGKAKAKSNSNAIGRALGGLVGGSFGPAGAALGQALGSGAQALFRRITGHGDYEVKSNSLVQGSVIPQDQLPSFGSMGRGHRIKHREFIRDVISSGSAGAYSLYKFPIQPAYSFPWLSNLAQNYQEYTILGMVFEFKSTSSDALNSSNTALGTVVMSTQYNVLQSDPVNKQQQEQQEFTTTCKPSQSMIHPIECSRGESMVSVLSTNPSAINIATVGDPRLYDFANFYISSVGLQGTSVNIGELWVSYDILLLKPKLGEGSDAADNYLLLASSGVDTTHYFGNPRAAVSSTSSLGTVLTDTTITFPSSFTGQVLLSWYMQGSSTTGGTSPSVAGSAGAVAANAPIGGNPFQNVSVSAIWHMSVWKITGGGVLTFSGGTLPTPGTFFDMLITVLPYDLSN